MCNAMIQVNSHLQAVRGALLCWCDCCHDAPNSATTSQCPCSHYTFPHAILCQARSQSRGTWSSTSDKGLNTRVDTVFQITFIGIEFIKPHPMFIAVLWNGQFIPAHISDRNIMLLKGKLVKRELEIPSQICLTLTLTSSFLLSSLHLLALFQ